MYFQQMVNTLNPNALIPGADTIKNDIMMKFNEEQLNFQKLFQVSFLNIYFLFNK